MWTVLQNGEFHSNIPSRSLDMEGLMKYRVINILKTNPDYLILNIKAESTTIIVKNLVSFIKNESKTVDNIDHLTALYEKVKKFDVLFEKMGKEEFASIYVTITFQPTTVKEKGKRDMISYETRHLGRQDTNIYTREIVFSFLELETTFTSVMSQAQKLYYESEKKLAEITTFVHYIDQIEVVPPINSSDLRSTQITYRLTFDSNDDVYEFFDSLVMSDEVPFAAIGDYYKIFKEFKNYFNKISDWTYEELMKQTDSKMSRNDDILFVKVFSSDDITRKNDPRSYSTIQIHTKRKADLKEKKNVEINRDDLQDEKDVHNKLLNRVIVYVHARSDYEKEEDLSLVRKMLHKVFNKDINVIPEPVSLISEFYLANVYYDTPILYDLSMNDDMFNKFIVFNESDRAERKRDSLFFYIHYHEDIKNPIGVSLKQAIVPASDTRLKVITKQLNIDLQNDEPYIKMTIRKSKTKEEALKYKSLICKLLYFYDEKRAGVIERYKDYIPDYEDQLDTLQEQVLSKTIHKASLNVHLKTQAPEIFRSHYQTMCQSRQNPRIVTEDEAKDLEEDGIQTIIFPRTQNEADHYKVPRLIYACNHCTEKEGFTHPGIILNSMKSGNLPILPCCFHDSQVNKTNSLYYEYYTLKKSIYKKDPHAKSYFQKLLDNPDKGGQRELVSTNKIQKRGAAAQFLPENIVKLLTSINPSYNFFRFGTIRGPHSVIDALLFATEFNNYKTLSDNDKDDRIRNVRMELIASLEKSEVLQNAYQHNAKLLKEYLSDPTRYIDPKLFITLLEDYFNVKIFILSQDDSNPRLKNGLLQAPYHTQKYLQLSHPKPKAFVLLYELMGSKVDKLQYPQCQLIRFRTGIEKTFVEGLGLFQLYKTKKPTEPKFLDFYNKLNSVFNLMYNIPSHKVDVDFKSEIISQNIDFYGKTRFVKLRYQSIDVVVATEPIPTLCTYYDPDMVYEPVPFSVATGLMMNEGIAVPEYRYYGGNKLIGMVGIKGSIKFYVPIEPTEFKEQNSVNILRNTSSINERTLSLISPSFIKDKSQIDDYNSFIKMSRYMTEYIMYKYSKWWKMMLTHETEEQKFDPLSLDSISLFGDEAVVVGNSNYSYIKRAFDEDSSYLNKNGQIIVPDSVIKQRLLYALYIVLKNSKSIVQGYHENKYIQGFYVDIRDFKQDSFHIILYKDNMLMQYVKSERPIYSRTDSVKPLYAVPYFMKNVEITVYLQSEKLWNSMFIVQPCNTLVEAINHSLQSNIAMYNIDKKNMVQNVSEATQPYTLITYYSNSSISAEYINGGYDGCVVMTYIYNNNGTPTTKWNSVFFPPEQNSLI